MREARVRASGSRQLRRALERNQISLYRAREITRLRADQQKDVLAQWTEQSRRRTEGSAIAARVIRSALHKSQVDLTVIALAIRDAIAKARERTSPQADVSRV